eukprot:8513280-Alexandrium_andersonii.AAC.1
MARHLLLCSEMVEGQLQRLQLSDCMIPSRHDSATSLPYPNGGRSLLLGAALWGFTALLGHSWASLAGRALASVPSVSARGPVAGVANWWPARCFHLAVPRRGALLHL